MGWEGGGGEGDWWDGEGWSVRGERVSAGFMVVVNVRVGVEGTVGGTEGQEEGVSLRLVVSGMRRRGGRGWEDEGGMGVAMK